MRRLIALYEAPVLPQSTGGAPRLKGRTPDQFGSRGFRDDFRKRRRTKVTGTQFEDKE